jgi:tetratricopeptide (TPR) repeat protein
MLKAKLSSMLMVLVFPVILISQNVEQLKNLLPEEKQKEKRLEILQKIAFKEVDSDSILKYGSEALEAARQLKDVGQYKIISDSVNVLLWSRRGLLQLIDFNKPQIEYFLIDKDTSALIDKYWKIGVGHEVLEHFTESEQFYLQAEQWSNAGNISEHLPKIYSGLGRVYKYVFDDSLALVYMHKGFDLAFKDENWRAYATASNGLGLFYFHNEDYAQAIEYYEKIFPVEERIDKKELTAASYTNLGAAYSRIDSTEKAVSLFFKSIDLYFAANVLHDLDVPYEGLGITYRKMSDLKKALKYHQKAYEIRKKYHKTNYYVSSISNITLVLSELNRAEEALVFLKNENMLGDSLEGFKSWQHAQAVATTYEKLGNYKKALACQQFAFSLKDTLINKTQTQMLKIMEARFKSKQREAELKLERSEKKVAQYWNIGLSAGLFILVVFILLLAYLLKQRKDQNRRLESSNKTLLKLNEKLSEELEVTQNELIRPEVLASKTITLTSNGKEVVQLGEIICIKAEGKAVQIFTPKKTYWDWVTLGSYETILPEQLFLKVHRSYIVNVLHIRNRKANTITLSNGNQINIGKTQKERVQKMLNKREV